MFTDILRTPFPSADSDRHANWARDIFIGIVCTLVYAIVATTTQPSGIQWNAYYLPVLTSAFLVPVFLYQTYRSKRVFTLGFVLANQLVNCVFITMTFAAVELLKHGFRGGLDLGVALAILFLTVPLEIFVVRALFRCMASPKVSLQDTKQSENQ